MTKISDLVDFRDDLFFGGAVQIDWFHTRPEKRDKAASHFVFHGPNYFGVDTKDRSEAADYSRIDTVSLTRQLIDCVEPEKNGAHFLGLAIAGYGAGKSHYGLTLAQLLSDPKGRVSQKILENISAADKEMGKEIRNRLEAWQRPVLVIPINGMEDFNLADELSRQVMIRLRNEGLDTEPIDELRPRFRHARHFVEENFHRIPKKFAEVFGKSATKDAILSDLANHDNVCFEKVNRIEAYAGKGTIPISGAESPKALIHTVCTRYCGEEGPFSSLLILFDEFGRYLEFAAARPYIAGDAAIQQIFEGVHDQSDRSFMLCMVQYELNAYISRVSHENRDAIKRYLGRYNDGRKYFLSSNLETLFAHLIEKRDENLLDKLLFQDAPKKYWEALHDRIQKWYPRAVEQAVWRDFGLFRKTVVKGGWPLHPLAIRFLTSLGDDLQNRSSVTFIKAAIDRHKKKNLPEAEIPWTIPATGLFCGTQTGEDPLLEELISNERFGLGGSIVQAYLSADERYGNKLTDKHREILLAVLIAAKMGLKTGTEADAQAAFADLSGLPLKTVQAGIRNLTEDFGVLEWDPKFGQYEIIRDAVPKSVFMRFLREKAKEIDTDRIERFFSHYIRKWSKLPCLEVVDPEFALVKKITTTEWQFTGISSDLSLLPSDINRAVLESIQAVLTDQPRGMLIFVYVPAGEKPGSVKENVERMLKERLKKHPDRPVPLFMVMICDPSGEIGQMLSERWILDEELGKEEKNRFKNFIDDYRHKLEELLKDAVENALKERRYILPPHPGKKIISSRLQSTAFALFERIYPQVVEFPFDGFHTSRGNAAKDCREMTAALFTGALDHEWVQASKVMTQNRVNNVLARAWKVFGNDGKVADYPKHQVLRKLSRDFDERLSDKKEIRLGEMFDHLTEPPYGMNIASAGLFLGTFISPRLGRIALQLKDETLSPAQWLGSALSGSNYLDRDLLNRTTLIHVETSQWENLLNRWTAEQTHSGRATYAAEAEKLMTQVPLPEGLLRERCQHLAEKAQQSLKALKQWDDFIEKQQASLEKATEQENAAKAAKVGSEAAAYEKGMQGAEFCWREEEIRAVAEIRQGAVAAVQDHFDKWLGLQSILKAQQIGEFRHRMLEKTGAHLKILGLTDLQERLEKHVLSIIDNIETLQKVHYIVDATKAFLGSRNVSEFSKIGELKEWIAGGEELLDGLKEAKQIKAVPEIEEMARKVRAFIADCKKRRTLQRDRHDALLNRPFATIGEIRDLRAEARELATIFVGQEIELSDLSRLEQRLAWLESDFSRWNDYSIPTDTLKQKVAEQIKALKAQEDEDDELPEWRDTETVYSGFLTHLLAERNAQSEKWLDDLDFSPKAISRMNPQTCQGWLTRLNAAPVYLTEKDRGRLSEWSDRLEKRMADLKVEGLLALFRNLSADQQRRFFEMIAAEMGVSGKVKKNRAG